MSTPLIKRKKTANITLTKYELLHLRDLMSVSLPNDGAQTVSTYLANIENRQLIEAMLWNKIFVACKEVDLPTGDEAPDYIVSPVGLTPLGVFQISSEPAGMSSGENIDLSDEDDD